MRKLNMQRMATRAATWTARRLPRTAREILTYALHNAADAEHEKALFAIVREVLAQDLPHVAGVVFYAGSEWDNGTFLDSDGRVYFTDGRDPERFDFDGAAEHLTTLYGAVGTCSGLAVIPATGETYFTDYDHELEPWITEQTTRKPAHV